MPTVDRTAWIRERENVLAALYPVLERHRQELESEPAPDRAGSPGNMGGSDCAAGPSID